MRCQRSAQRLLALLLPLLLLGCQGTRVVVSAQQRAACRSEAEKAPTPEQALKRNAACLTAALKGEGPPPAPASPAAQPAQPPPAAAPIDRYLYCRVHQEKVLAASARLTNATKPLLLASKRYAPDSEEVRAAQQAYNAAVAELEQLLPPEIRNGMDLLPTAVEAYSRCDRQVLERTPGP
ncbi:MULTISPECIES: hypothetical protein [unclassified Cyanobium]|uniref:hypothetical protein n=1 Tax=unclassified Cyanobium TaxID=2627006 RepID=UPI0020CBB159|nr:MULTISPECIES: hypothetical protein [unclassified Cyanobium]MCP9860833.1 hypothetical protein [Cyanobium sp. Cruz-8H5]MCP9868058.1 hypothetical protein [Cyanobium sp. Cruz-8D1]